MIPIYPRLYRGPRRSGFTLIELLIVIGIIAILMALSWGATLRYMGMRMRLNSQETVQKVGEAIKRQWAAGFDAANNVATSSPDYAPFVGMANQQQARVMFRKYYLRREFPISFAEVMSPAGGLPRKSAYVAAVQSAGGGLTPDEECATCLYIALKQTRRGHQFDPDTALSSRELTDSLSNGSSLGGGLKMIVDDWRTPLRLYRWPWGSLDLNPGGKPSAQADKDDPAGDLAGVGGSFTTDCHPVPGRGKAYKMEPTIVSGGENLAAAFTGLDPRSMAPIAPISNSCIYSYSLRLGGHGDN